MYQERRYPDGRMESYAYENGAYSAASRTFTPGIGFDIRESTIREHWGRIFTFPGALGTYLYF